MRYDAPMNLSLRVQRACAFVTSALSVLCAMSLLAMTFAGAAHADVPPPEGYVEQCTIERQQSAESHCEACGTYHGERERCVTQYASTPFTKRCQTAGASVWTEVWCRSRASTDPQIAGAATPTPSTTPASQPSAVPARQRSATPQAATSEAADESCSVAAAGASRSARTAPWALLAVALLVIRARRRTQRA